MATTRTNAIRRRLVLPGLIVLAVSCCLWFLFGRSNHTIDIQGTVVRQAGGAPVPDAKILVTVYEARFMEVTTPHLFTCIANQQGRFRMQATSPIRVDGLRIEACAPDNHYAIDENSGHTVTLRVKPLGYNDDLAPKYRYGTFSGKYGHRRMRLQKVPNTAK